MTDPIDPPDQAHDPVAPTTDPGPPRMQREWLSRRAAGKVMLGVAGLGVFAALLGMIVAWQFVGQLSVSTQRSLMLANDALVTVDDTLDLAEELVTSLDDGLDGVATSLLILTDVVDDTTSVAGATARLAEELAPGLEAVDTALGSLASIASAADVALRELSRLPFGPDYAPDRPVDEEIRTVRSELRPVIATLRETAVELDELAGSSDQFTAELVSLATAVVELRNSVAGANALIEGYRSTVRESARLAEDTRGDLQRDLDRSRLLIVLLGISIAVGQIVPAWLGRELLIEDGFVRTRNG